MKPKFKIGQTVAVKGLEGTYKISTYSFDEPNGTILYQFEGIKDIQIDEEFILFV